MPSSPKGAAVRSGMFATVTVPDGLWDSPAARDALARREMGAVFRHFRRYTGASQTTLGSLIGLAQSDVSDIERGVRQVTSLDVTMRIAEGLHIPVHLLGLVPAQSPPTEAGSGWDDPVMFAAWTEMGTVQALRALTTTDPGGPMERRDFLVNIAATALVTAATRWLNTTPALPESAAGRNVTTPVVEALHTRLDACSQDGALARRITSVL
jgi:DNA-binding XRE family transcriptional regulator